MKNKTIQMFSKEYLDQSKNLTKEQIFDFLEDFRNLVSSQDQKRILISIRIPSNILEAFKIKASLENIPYQTKLVELMRKSLL